MTNFKKPTLIPSERASKDPNIGILAWNHTIYRVKGPSKVTQNLYSVSCKGCKGFGKCILNNGIFQNWILKPQECDCQISNRTIRPELKNFVQIFDLFLLKNFVQNWVHYINSFFFVNISEKSKNVGIILTVFFSCFFLYTSACL